ncbi:DUF2927 domain-containing protein [Aeromonas salmonicida]|uniref:DUF2927 domain-containing protein n=1 Tax=Aeromonas salmonicida TaxID=645 RepID=UPI00232AA07E|nr:DUF2927 domain-containing protein [Aeromonas salmonicida]WCH21064.1 DUF2927 domain-containing protein [Aeromonas salmonicida]
MIPFRRPPLPRPRSVMFKGWLTGVWIMMAQLLAQPLTAAERWQSDAYLIDSFFEVAMKREYGEEQNVRFARWQQPIRLKLINEFGDKPLQTEVVKIQSQHLAGIIGHPIILVNDKPNITLIMTERARMANWAKRTMGQGAAITTALKEGLCMANFAINARYEIARATIIIPVDYSRAKGRFLDCVVEELTQVMGLPNDSDKVFPSIFNDNSIDSFPTGLDYVLLKLAYHPALHAGMTAAEVRAALPVAIKALRANGEITQADQKVQVNSLKRWAGL